MRVQPVIDQLGELGFRTIGGALEFAALRTAPGRLPAAFVMPESKTAGENRLGSGALDQKISCTFGVVLVLAAEARVGAAGINEDLERLERAVIDRLFGWQHPDATRPTELVGGSLMSADGTALVWRLAFRTTYHIRKV